MQPVSDGLHPFCEDIHPLIYLLMYIQVSLLVRFERIGSLIMILRDVTPLIVSVEILFLDSCPAISCLELQLR